MSSLLNNSSSHTTTTTICQQCGACCVTYRVSFYWSETEVFGLAESLTEQISPFYSCMTGTNQPSPRCMALKGMVGETVSCGVYEQRPSPCRELQPGEEKCNKARIRHGLPPLTIG